MTEKSYIANYHSALSYLKLNLKDQAAETMRRALSQISQEDMREDNPVYLGILSNLAVLSLEKSEFEKAWNFVIQGLLVKKNHLDLLFLKSVLLMDQRRYDEVLEAIIHYLLALPEEGERAMYDYKYKHEGALNEVYNNLLPTSYKCAFQYLQIRGIAERLCKTTDNEFLKKAYDIMVMTDSKRSDKEH